MSASNFPSKVKSRRVFVRAVSFAAALVIVLCTFSAISYATARRYRTYVEHSYQRALSELSNYITGIDAALAKGQYSNTAPQIQKLVSHLQQETAGAKAVLAQLPSNAGEIESAAKFLSQLGGYCSMLSIKISEGGTITEEDSDMLDTLAGYAGEMSAQINNMVAEVSGGRMLFGEVQREIESGRATNQGQIRGISDGFNDLNTGFSDYPVMIFDGPFSDHIQQRTSRMLEDIAEIDAAQARSTAQTACGGTLTSNGETGGNLPCYRFSGEDCTVSVTKSGGMVEEILRMRPVGEPELTAAQALERAGEELRRFGITEFTNRYYVIDNGVLVANFAAVQDGVVLYPDLIKVGITLDDGTLYSYEARDYILAHARRDFPEITVSEQQAQEVLSPKLTPISHSMALIPADGLKEVLCHEFLCTGRDDEQILVYINVETGAEQEILRMLTDESGVLVL